MKACTSWESFTSWTHWMFSGFCKIAALDSFLLLPMVSWHQPGPNSSMGVCRLLSVCIAKRMDIFSIPVFVCSLTLIVVFALENSEYAYLRGAARGAVPPLRGLSALRPAGGSVGMPCGAGLHPRAAPNTNSEVCTAAVCVPRMLHLNS